MADNNDNASQSSTSSDSYTDVFTTTTTTTWLERLSGSLFMVVVGFIMFLLAFPLFFWNEGRSVERIKALDEGQNLVIAVPADSIDPVNNGKLIHISGHATTDEVLSDAAFGVSLNTLKLKRKVEMFQWKEEKHDETKKNFGGSETHVTNYSYSKVWSDKLISSTGFKKIEGHANPATMPYKSQDFTAKNIRVGAFNLSDQHVKYIDKEEPVAITDAHYAAMDASLKSAFKPNGTGYFYGDPNSPQIGAIRITYTATLPTDVSAIGDQRNNAITSHYSKHGDIALLETDNVGPDAMFKHAQTDNSLFTWGMRVGGCVLMWLGLGMMLSFLRVLADVIPFLGDIVFAGISLVTFLVALTLSTFTIAVAWIAYRPLLGILLIGCAAGIFVASVKYVRYRKTRGLQAVLPPLPVPHA